MEVSNEIYIWHTSPVLVPSSWYISSWISMSSSSVISSAKSEPGLPMRFWQIIFLVPHLHKREQTAPRYKQGQEFRPVALPHIFLHVQLPGSESYWPRSNSSFLQAIPFLQIYIQSNKWCSRRFESSKFQNILTQPIVVAILCEFIWTASYAYVGVLYPGRGTPSLPHTDIHLIIIPKHRLK